MDLEQKIEEAEQKWEESFPGSMMPDFLAICDLISEVREDEIFEEEGEASGVVEAVMATIMDESAEFDEPYTSEELDFIGVFVYDRNAELD